jgi:hypothetical protein
MESMFEERPELIARLGIEVLPSEELKSGQILCWLTLTGISDE